MWRTIPRARIYSSNEHRLSLERHGAVQVGGSPSAIAITDKGPGNTDYTVFVTQIFAELNPDFKDPTFAGNGEGRDLGKQGVVQAFPAGNANPPITKITLKPLANSGFSANRVAPNNFCNTVPPAQSNIFCPRPDLPAMTPQTRTTRRGCSRTNSCRQ